jgi:hypothetical protein
MPMSEPESSIVDAKPLLEELIAFVEKVLEVLEAECNLMRRYRDDPEYRKSFDAALAKRAPTKNKAPGRGMYTWNAPVDRYWPSRFERRPLSQSRMRLYWKAESFSGRFLDLTTDGAPHELLFRGIELAILDFNCSWDDILLVNSIDLLDGRNRVCRKLPEREKPVGKIRYGRLTYTEKQLAACLEGFLQNSKRLIRYCRQTIELIEALDHVHIDDDTFSVAFRGIRVQLGKSKQFDLLHELVRCEGCFVQVTDLAERIGKDGLDNIAHIVARLRKALKDGGLGVIADAIETEPGHYGLFISKRAIHL